MIRHVAGLAEVVDDLEAAIHVYRSVLGLEVHEEGPGYALVRAPGLLHFGLWTRAAAAEAVLGDTGRADEVPLGLTLAFEVDSVDEAGNTLTAAGVSLLQLPKTEPWGQRTSRFLLPSGSLGEMSETPWARRLSTNVTATSDEEPGA